MIQAFRNPSRARTASCDTAAGFMPSRGATWAGFICSISVYQSTSCHRVGRLRNARWVSPRSSASSAASSVESGSATVSSSSIAVSLRARPQLAAALRIEENR